MKKYIHFLLHVLLLPIDVVIAAIGGFGAFFRTIAAHMSIAVADALAHLREKGEKTLTEKVQEVVNGN